MEKHDKYSGMQHRFDITRLFDAARRQAGFYPGMPPKGNIYPNQEMTFSGMPTAPALSTETAGGTPIRRQDVMGRWYFMPVWVRSSLGELELPCAVISVTGKKRIVETPLVGRRGTVNELVRVDSYQVNITSTLVGKDGNYPEEALRQVRNLYELNESVELISALTDIIFENDDKVVIEKIDLPPLSGAEDLLIVKLTAHTDAAIELIME